MDRRLVADIQQGEMMRSEIFFSRVINQNVFFLYTIKRIRVISNYLNLFILFKLVVFFIKKKVVFLPGSKQKSSLKKCGMGLVAMDKGLLVFSLRSFMDPSLLYSWAWPFVQLGWAFCIVGLGLLGKETDGRCHFEAPIHS